MSEAKSCSSCSSDSCSTQTKRPDESMEEFQERQVLAYRMGQIKHKIMVLSGKGGVGKSTVAVNLAVSLGLAGKKVGLLDVDIHGPSIPTMLKLDKSSIRTGPSRPGGADAIYPVTIGDNIKVISIAFFLQSDAQAVIWRGPLKMGAIKQFLKDVEWGELDYLIIDSPPGTGDEPLSVCQLIEDTDGSIIVTTPQKVSISDVKRSINFCHVLNLPVLGILENMSGFVCPECGKQVDIFKSGGGEELAKAFGIRFLGRIPLDPQIVESCDDGKPYVYHYARTETAKAFGRVIVPLLEMDGKKGEVAGDQSPVASSQSPVPKNKEDGKIRIAMPVAGGQLCMHFGHSEEFALFDVEDSQVKGKQMLTPPPHAPGVLPKWLHEQGANIIIAGGMGSRAQNLFEQHGVHVVIGAPGHTPEEVVTAYLNGTLETGRNVCDH
ncbi:MAG: iron-sulfur cluster carrier protein MrpORP [bacterium]|nr:iron-sulfur cluster carrier protein MrpORP [bacterium]